MSHLILVRHGQSEWNLENRFTGWVDVDLAPTGKLEACKAGELIKEKKIKFDYFFTSYQKRAINTLKLILNTLRIKDAPIVKAWQLNERHYGSLTGLNKDEMKKKLGEKKVHAFRRSWNIKPDPLSKNNPYHPVNIEAYKDIPLKNIPDTESLKDTYDRVVPYFEKNIEKHLRENKNIILSAHGNTIRALGKKIFNISDKSINLLEIPTGNPLVIHFDNSGKVLSTKYLDESRKTEIISNQ